MRRVEPDLDGADVHSAASYHEVGRPGATLMGYTMKGDSMYADEDVEVEAPPSTPPFPLREGQLFGPKSIQREIVHTHEGISTVQDILGSEQSTGVYDKGTYREVVVYQRDHGLPITGLVDAATWESLHAGDHRE